MKNLYVGRWMFALMLLVFCPSATSAPQFEFPNDADFVLLEYHQWIPRIANQDQQPLLRIYGNGQVVVHFPDYMKQAGDYEMTLPQQKLNILLGSLEQNGIFSFDQKKVKQLKIQSENFQKSNSLEFSTRSEEVISDIRINLALFSPDASGSPIPGFSKIFKWTNLKWDAQKHADVPELVNAAAAEQQLDELLNHPDLKKLK